MFLRNYFTPYQNNVTSMVVRHQLVLDNEVLLGILFNDTMEINISVIELFVFYQSTKNLR